MHVLHARNVNDAYAQLFSLVDSYALRDSPLPSRNGPVYRFPCPVATVFDRPWERVLFHEGRNANPFFHLMESIWMLLGKRDVKSISYFNAGMHEYSDDKVNFNAAYGHRWCEYFGYDQISAVINILRKDPYSRRAVLGMWNPARDLIDQGSLDLPCNLNVKFFVRPSSGGIGNILDMVVMNRSNDMIWGAYGANSVHMSVLQEYIAKGAGMQMGRYTQFSADAHVYADMFDKLPDPREDVDVATGYPNTQPIVQDVETFMGEAHVFWERTYSANSKWSNPFLFETAHFVRSAWDAYKLDRLDDALALTNSIEADDWREACREWIGRVQHKRAMKARGFSA